MDHNWIIIEHIKIILESCFNDFRINESHLNHHWITFESHLNHTVIIFALHLNHIWIIIESPLNHLWITFESRLNHMWITFESYLNHIWIIIESYVNHFRTCWSDFLLTLSIVCKYWLKYPVIQHSKKARERRKTIFHCKQKMELLSLGKWTLMYEDKPPLLSFCGSHVFSSF